MNLWHQKEEKSRKHPHSGKRSPQLSAQEPSDEIHGDATWELQRDKAY